MAEAVDRLEARVAFLANETMLRRPVPIRESLVLYEGLTTQVLQAGFARDLGLVAKHEAGSNGAKDLTVTACGSSSSIYYYREKST
jgi:hypothetical protein